MNESIYRNWKWCQIVNCLSCLLIAKQGGTMDNSFTVKTTFSKQQLEYGTRKGYQQLILALNKDDPTKGDYITNLSLKDAIAFLQRKVNIIVC